MAASGTGANALAARAADEMEAALDAERAEADLPTPLAEQLRAGVNMLREAADPALSGSDRKMVLDRAIKQLATPSMIFLPADLTKAAEEARMLADRARKAN